MTQIDLGHHKIIALLLAFGVFLLGTTLGVRIGSASGTEGLLVMTFSLSLLSVVLLIVLFAQMVHLRDDTALRQSPKTKVRR